MAMHQVRHFDESAQDDEEKRGAQVSVVDNAEYRDRSPI